MSYLIFDTETSGMPSKDLPASHPKQARILQLACLAVTKDFQEIGSFCSLVSPSTDFEIHPKAVAAHGITRERCVKEGLPVRQVLDEYNKLFNVARNLIGFNLQFDVQMLDIELTLLGLNRIPPESQFCVMNAMTPICKLPSKWRGNKYKWPKLIEAYKHCFGKSFDGAHDALADVRATASVYKWLKETWSEKEIIEPHFA